MSTAADRHWWVPLADAGALPDGVPQAVQAFDDALVLWRDGAALSVLIDRCPHRGARLSLGRVDGGTLECPYHGWRFGADGACRRIPAVPGFEPPPSHAARAWQVQLRHGLVFAAPADAPAAEPWLAPMLDGLPATRVVCGPFDVATSAPRVVENFLDTAHFGIVHAGWLGARSHLEVPAYEVVHDAFGRPGVPHYRAWQPQASSATSAGAWIDYRYQLLSPFAALLDKRADGAMPAEAYALWTSPVGRDACRAWFTIFTADANADAQALREFQQRIFAQDRPIVESQRPRELPVSGGEVHCAADRLSAAYRRWLRDLGFGYGCC